MIYINDYEQLRTDIGYIPNYFYFKNDVIIQDGIGGSREEYIMLTMRLTKGIDLSEYEKIFGNIATKDFLRKIEKYQKYDYIDVVENKVFFTPKGMLISNTILSDLIY